MAFNHFFTRVLVTLSVLSTVFAASPPYALYSDTTQNFAVAVNVPNNSTDDLFFHFHAPGQCQWAAFGFGQGMAGSLIFLAYPAANGQNVTLSPRLASGHTQPQYTNGVQVKLLDGSGVQSDGSLVVNAQCSNCRQWTVGGTAAKIDITSSSQSLIYALGPQGAGLNSNDPQASIKQHSDYYGTYSSFNLQSAVGVAGVPDLSSNTQQPSNGSSGSNDGDSDGPTMDFPIVIHAILMVGCFLVVLPAGYLFLRVFEKVWLHAGIQTVGVVCVIGGVIAGVVCNTQHKLTISYHQVLGIITSILVLTAFTLGLISHQYYKKHKVSSPLMKFHRMAGPGAITFGWATTITGFVYKGSTKYIVPYVLMLVGVILFVGGMAFLMHKRKMRQAALKTPAAQNFNDGYYQQQQQQPQYAQQPAYASDGVPMQTFSRPFPPQQQQQQGGYAYPTQQQGLYLQKGPDVNIRHV